MLGQGCLATDLRSDCRLAAVKSAVAITPASYRARTCRGASGTDRAVSARPPV
jgi:hypothetical protein